MRALSPTMLFAVSAALALACGMPSHMGPGFMPAPVQPGQADEAWPAAHSGPGKKGAKQCDPEGCHDFCSSASCLFEEMGTGAKCMAICMARCGDGLFDDQDAAVIACLAAAGPDLLCRTAQACCVEQINAQLCAE